MNYPGLIDSQDDVKPYGVASAWPELSDDNSKDYSIIDSDGDGMPDKWELMNNLNSFDQSDGNETNLSKEGYANLEIYLNSLVMENFLNQELDRYY